LGFAVSSCTPIKDWVEHTSVDPVVQYCAEGKVTENQSTLCVENETVGFQPINLDTFRFDDKPDELAIVAASGDPTYRNRLQALTFDKSIAACSFHMRFAFTSTAMRKGLLQFRGAKRLRQHHRLGAVPEPAPGLDHEGHRQRPDCLSQASRRQAIRPNRRLLAGGGPGGRNRLPPALLDRAWHHAAVEDRGRTTK
jgi:hypothetical protein